jgi:hypothetical protein
MSIERPCIHYKPDGICAKYSVNGDLSYCVQGPCPDETPSNADHIRAMSDEELARWICSIMTAECCGQRCPARDICNLGDNGLVKWMKQPEEDA